MGGGLSDMAEIKRLVNEQVETERRELAIETEPEPSRNRILEALARNEAGVGLLRLAIEKE